MSLRHAILLLATLTTMWGREVQAAPRLPMLPLATEDTSLNILYELEERPIWAEQPRQGMTVYRVTLYGINCRIHTVRFEERADGSARGEVKIWNRCSRDDAYDAHEFRLGSAKFAPVKAAMFKAELWQKPASYWTTQDADNICVDGIDVTFERRDALDYRMDQSNVWCSTTLAFVIAARLLLTAANDKAGLGLLPEVEDDR